MNQRYTDSYGNERVKLDAEWIERLRQAAAAQDGTFLQQMAHLAKRLGYLSVAQYERADKAVEFYENVYLNF